MSKSLRQAKFSLPKKLILIIAVFQLVACATTQVAENDKGIELQVKAVDPYEGFNRSMYGFNDALDSYVIGPVIDGYKWIAPDILETGISNVFLNMKGISIVLNDVLQGKLQQGAEDTGRFLLNSTAGLGGLFDVATYAGLDQNDEDFGQTLAVWGVPSGPYLVLPILGPSTFRGIPGSVVDTAANPVSYLGWTVAAMAALDKRASVDDSLQFIDDAAVDPYVFTRESYLQHRDYLATDGKQEFINDDLLEDFDNEEDQDLLSDAGDLGIDQINVQGHEQSLDKATDKTKQVLDGSSEESETKNADAVQSEQNSPEFEKAMRSFKRATRTYRKASDELEMIKKGDQ